MSVTERIRRRLEERFPEVLAGWLKTLPPAGFTGTTPQLWGSLNAYAPRHEPIPTPNKLLAALDRHSPILTAAGFRVRQHRTAAARLVTVERIPPARLERSARRG